MASRPAQRTGGKRSVKTGPNPLALRQIHTYVGAFIAPSVLFFALTGALQLFSLHEAHDGYQPPRLLVQLGSIHKDQRLAGPEHHDAGAKGGKSAHADGDNHDHADAGHHDHDHGGPTGAQARGWVLKWVFAVVAAGLVVSTGLGVWMALTFSRNKALVWSLLIAGAALPLLILFA